MRFLVGLVAMAAFAVVSATGVGAAGSKDYKEPDQQDDGDVVLTVGTDGSLSQPAPKGGRLECTLHNFVAPEEAPYLVGAVPLGPAEALVEEQYYWLTCTNAAGELIVARVFRYLPGVSIISPAELARRASSELAIRYPEPRTSPSFTIDQLVGIDTWMWIDGGAWQPITASAAIPGLSVSATATPERMEWDMGDGTVVTCAGPGTPYDPAVPGDQQSSDCTHLYQDRGAYTASATLIWSVSWSASDGGGGSLADVARTTQFPMRVVERQAVGR